ncbi:nicotinate-nucleotide adenylyltransferase [Fulvivirga sp. RKSG066]|uniref:nicotinate (nicotinamide) nucleotide adenylyltransferase n=1 Tax=Fulvivirga aurantia TaxID=2529383 RepID=UPI0012BC7E3F|nr:nicotinate (nicotinamide) nucleotide adenylyltransferase [Fulvivirga aurantia]MTI22002.1 nicotinate-nucleotide adenylyltransferase [Fulvivirga aurantia]
MKVGLFFGSFNPIHMGHMIIANVMATTTDLDEVWFVVSPQNPFKKRESLLHEFDRIDMVNAAIHDNYHLRATDVEFNMPKPSYTIDTLTYLSEKHPQHTFKLIIGEDNLKSFPKWKNSDLILDLYGLYVYPRPHAKPSDLKNHANVKLVEAPMIDISATFIRKCIKDNRSIKYLVPDAVEERIIAQKYYI